MAAVATVEKTIEIGSTERLVIGTLALDDSYPTGGEAVAIAGIETIDKLFASGYGYVYEWDRAAQKLEVRQQTDPADGGGADVPLVEVGSTDDLSAVVAAPFIAIGS